MVIAHEMCHAAVEFISKKNEKNPHGREWQRWAKKCNELTPKFFNNKIQRVEKCSAPDALTEEDMSCYYYEK